MDIKATVKDAGVSPSKVRFVINLVRGKKVDEALAILRFTPTPTARVVAKLIKSAASSAENNYQLVPADLKITKITADKGQVLKRYVPRSRGMVHPVLKRYSNITVIVSEQES